MSKLTPWPGGDTAIAQRPRQARSLTDGQVVASWLHAKASRSAATYDRYAREARFYGAFLQEKGLGLVDVSIDDLLAYEKRLGQGFQGRRPQTPAGCDGIFTVISGLYAHAQGMGHVSRNPVVMRQAAAPAGDTYIARALGADQLQALSDHLARLDPADGRTHRIRFVLSWCLMLTPRVSELTRARMSDVYLAREGARRVWFWRLQRKGNRPADVPVRSEAIEALRRYRLHLGLPEYPGSSQDDGYLVWPLVGPSTRALHRGTISNDLSGFFNAAADEMADTVMADHLRQATTHWLRHTGATRLLDAGVSIRHVSRLLGHSSINVTTRFYDHADREKWRSELENAPSGLERLMDRSE